MKTNVTLTATVALSPLSRSENEQIFRGEIADTQCALNVKFVLQSRGKVYRLDKPELAEPFAGQQVKVTGTLDPKTKSMSTRLHPLPQCLPLQNTKSDREVDEPPAELVNLM